MTLRKVSSRYLGAPSSSSVAAAKDDYGYRQRTDGAYGQVKSARS